jgi:demethylmenaquinone methyltransferase/2-methoxy-6-polyprenyl-1,4-benzoquinol methylase
MSDKERQFFDMIAERWDDLRSVIPPIIEGLVSMGGLKEGDRVLDAGCGTGVLVPYVKKAIGAAGTITAVDFAANMIALAAEKHKDLAGVEFIAADIMDYRAESPFDKIICFNFFPHVKDKPAFLLKMAGMLAEDGVFVIMHDIPRAKVNSIHGGCDAVRHDRLPEGAKTAELLTQAGLYVTDVIDDDEIYFVKAVRK